MQDTVVYAALENQFTFLRDQSISYTVVLMFSYIQDCLWTKNNMI